MKTALTDLLAINHPIIQAPMAGVSTPALAAAVSNAGALGSIALGAMTPEAAAQAIKDTRALTSNPFAVNFFVHKPAVPNPEKEAAWLDVLRPAFRELGAEPPKTLKAPYLSFLDNDAMLNLLLEARPPIVSFHFGLPPREQVQALKQAGCLLMATATSPSEAQAVTAAGIDVVVLQGYEAGGHRGIFGDTDPALSTLTLTSELAASLSVPVVAAGGIMNGTDISKLLKVGAAGAQLGTAFVPCPEAATSDTYRQKLLTAGPDATAITAFISGRPARGLINGFMHIDTKLSALLPDYPIAYNAGKALVTAASKKGLTSFSNMWAGTGANKSRLMSAADLVDTLVQEIRKSR